MFAASFSVNKIQARPDMHGMAAETPGDSPFLAVYVGEKGEAQHLTYFMCRDRDYTFSPFSHFLQRKFVTMRPLLP